MANTLARYKTIFSLSLVLLSLIIAPKTFAYYSQTFDSQSSGTYVSTVSGWGTSEGQILNTTYHSSPNSLAVATSTGQSSIYIATSSHFTTFSFYWLYTSKTTTNDFYFRVYDTATTSGRYIFSLAMRPNKAGDDVKIGNYALATSTSVANGLSVGTWYKSEVEYDNVNYRVRARLDDGAWSSWLGLGYTYTYSDYVNFNSNNGNTQPTYVDDFVIDAFNSIEFTQPLEGQTYALNPMNFIFNYTNLVPDFWDKIIISVNKTSIPAMSITPVYYDISTSTSATGIKSMILPDGDYTVQAYFYDSAIDLLGTSTSPISFHLSSTTVGAVELIDTVILSTSTDLFAGRQLASSTIHGSVCTAEEWATPDPEFNWGFATTSLPFFNLTKIKCTLLDSAWNFSDSVSSFAKSSIDHLASLLKIVFPFNLFVNFYDSWQSSVAELPASMSVITDTVDSSGNITLLLPEGFGSTTAVVWGTAAFTGNTRLLSIFAFIRAFSTWLMWASFIYMCYRLAEQVYEDLQGTSSNDFKKLM